MKTVQASVTIDGDQRPDDHAHGERGQVIAEGHAKEIAVDPAERDDGHQHAEGDPELSDSGSLIALPDVVHPEQQPYPPIGEAVPQIAACGGDVLFHARAVRRRSYRLIVGDPLDAPRQAAHAIVIAASPLHLASRLSGCLAEARNLLVAEAEFPQHLRRVLAEQRTAPRRVRGRFAQLDRGAERAHAAEHRVFGFEHHAARHDLGIGEHLRVVVDRDRRGCRSPRASRARSPAAAAPEPLRSAPPAGCRCGRGCRCPRTRRGRPIQDDRAARKGAGTADRCWRRW